MSRDNLQTLIERLSTELGLSDLRLDAELDACGFQADGKIDVLIEYEEESDTVLLTATVGKLPPVEERASLLQQLLDANYYGVGSGGGTLATNSDAGEVYLQIRESTEQLDQKRFAELLQTLLNNAEVWNSRLSGTPAGELASDEDGNETSGGGLHDFGIPGRLV